LYLPLGGNRKGARRTYLNLTIVMLLGGLWHGANWTFVVWGAYHGLLLAFERWRGKRSFYERLPHEIRVGFTFVLVLFSWVLFRSADLPHAALYFRAMFGMAPQGVASSLLAAEIYTPYYAAGMILCAAISFQRVEVYDWVENLSWSRALALAPLSLFAIGAMFTQSFNPFLYFQF
jgi:alginate O-acetyltransferase complex protein AlgI